MDKVEMMKVFDFILENKNIIIGENGLFSRDTLTLMRTIVKGKVSNHFSLTKEQEQLVINTFLNSNQVFNEDTPEIILTNEECIDAAINRDLNSIYFIKEFTDELTKKILNLAIAQKYILTSQSPTFLRRNNIVASNSIRQNPNSANYVDWKSLEKKDVDYLIKETIKSGYILSWESSSLLTENPDIVFNSIVKDMQTVYYSSEIARDNPKIFKYLISNGYEFYEQELKNKPLSTFIDKDSLRYALEKTALNKKNSYLFLAMEHHTIDVDKYLERYVEFYYNAINTFPTIKSFNNILQVGIESEWEEYRKTNINNYANIFGKICTELKNNPDFKNALTKLRFLPKMKVTLGDKYGLLSRAMEQYHTLVHNNVLENMNYNRDQIAKLSALYVSISKENFKKERLQKYLEELKEYFIPRKNHPIIYKKLIEHKYKDNFKELYQKKENTVCAFLENLVNQYSKNIGKENIWCITIWDMIDNFLNNGYSKMESFIKAPSGWNDYKRYQEASKLINRLNNHYIKYTDKELVRYDDIIEYNIKNKKYDYTGPSFSEEDITKYNDYKEKIKIFNKIKQQIIFKAKKLPTTIDISTQELMAISKDLPFTDEYFEFQKSITNDFSLTLNDLIKATSLNLNYIEPSSLLDDEAYQLLTNYVVHNGLIWNLLLREPFFSTYQGEKEQEFILETFDNMKEIAKLAKIFHYDTNKYEDIITLCKLGQCADEETIAILGKETIFKLCTNLEYTDTEENETEIIKIAKELVCEMVKKEKSTVPYIKGTYNNYKYSMYDSQDETILLAGIDTDACFKIDGTDNDFLHYCALDKNGFVIKITDAFDNFIGRASGFRNGNFVYINQLRTIFDEGGNGYAGNYESEKIEIIETFRQACEDIIKISQKNTEEKDKIDFVFVTQSYALAKTKSNVDQKVSSKIEYNLINKESEDWKDFVNNTKNLQEIDNEDDTFTTDYGNYSLICIASNKMQNKITVHDIHSKDVKAIYKRPRNTVIMTKNPDINIMNKINKINGIYSYLNETDFENVVMPKDQTVFLGDNWYIIFDGQQIIKSTVLDFDSSAKQEFETAMNILKQYLEKPSLPNEEPQKLQFTKRL